MTQQQVKKEIKRKDQTQEEVKANEEVIEKGKKTIKEAGDLIDKIDDILEENAEEHVKNYIQKGGE